jgi:hypothetical protein
MPSRTFILAIAAMAAIVAGTAAGFFELIVLGVVVAIAAAALALHETPGR